MKAPFRAALATCLVCVANGGRALGADPACADEPGAHTHDGFFARSEPGLALFWANVSGSNARPARSGIRGIGQSAELELGGTPAPGVVLGGSVWTGRIDPVFVAGGKAHGSDDDSVKVTQLRLGPFLDYYPWPKRGFHTSVVLSLVIEFESDTKGDALKPPSYGPSLATATGYEWFISSEVSFGVLGRMGFGSVARSVGGTTERILFITPELALTATYH